VETAYVFQELSNLPEGFTVPAGRSKPWGTGQAVLVTAPSVRQAFGVINADDFYGRESFEVLGAFLRDTAGDDARYAMVGFELLNTLSDHGSVARGICSVGPGGRLETVVERTAIRKEGGKALCSEQELRGDELVSMNMWGFKASIFGHLRQHFREFLRTRRDDPKAEFFIPTVVNALLHGQVSVDVLPSGCRWLGVTNREDKTVVVDGIRALIDQGAYPADLWSSLPQI
jgi:hypothetical protein